MYFSTEGLRFCWKSFFIFPYSWKSDLSQGKSSEKVKVGYKTLQRGFLEGEVGLIFVESKEGFLTLRHFIRIKSRFLESDLSQGKSSKRCKALDFKKGVVAIPNLFEWRPKCSWEWKSIPFRWWYCNNSRRTYTAPPYESYEWRFCSLKCLVKKAYNDFDPSKFHSLNILQPNGKRLKPETKKAIEFDGMPLDWIKKRKVCGIAWTKFWYSLDFSTPYT